MGWNLASPSLSLEIYWHLSSKTTLKCAFNVNTKKSLRSRSVHTVLNLLIPELVPWGHTSGSKNQGKPLICSATWTRLLQAYACLCRIKRDEGREAGARVAWRLHKYLFSGVSNCTCPFHLIWSFLLWCNGRRGPETYRNLLSEWELSDWVVKWHFLFALVQ